MPATDPSAKKRPPGLLWKRLAYSPTGGVEFTCAPLVKQLVDGKYEYTQEELDSFAIEALDWKSFIRHQDGGLDIFFQPIRPPKKDPPILVVIVGIFILLAIYGFFWALWKMGLHSYEFFSDVDVTSPPGAAIVLFSASLLVFVLYYSFYPEGQLARDAVQGRGAGRATFAYKNEKRA